MDTNRTNAAPHAATAPQGSSLEFCQPGTNLGSAPVQLSQNTLVTARENIPSFIPQHSLSQTVPLSTRPEFLSSTLAIKPVEQETVNLAND
jgi:hypothetical protein